MTPTITAHPGESRGPLTGAAGDLRALRTLKDELVLRRTLADTMSRMAETPAARLRIELTWTRAP